MWKFSSKVGINFQTYFHIARSSDAKNIIWFKCFPESLFLSLVTILPALKSSLSEGTEVARSGKYSRATLYKLGFAGFILFHSSNGFTWRGAVGRFKYWQSSTNKPPAVSVKTKNVESIAK